MKKVTINVLLCLSLGMNAQTITTLTANGAGNTYEDINAVFTPGSSGNNSAVEAPGITTEGDCTNHHDFNNGEENNNNRHIQEVYDNYLQKDVFKFIIHVDGDIDRDKCETTDRQRNEIKTYASSPDYLLGTLGETVEYKWKFKLPEGFQASSSFTHIHQLKSVGGITEEESVPMITFTIYKKTAGDRFELRYSENTSQSTISGYNFLLANHLGNWIEVVEKVTYGYEGDGSYEVKITNIETDEVLIDYFNNTASYYKTDADFIRPKWGIYRSLNNAIDLRDEEILYADFSITEWPNSTLSNENFEDIENLKKLEFYPNPSSEIIHFPALSNDANKYKVQLTNTYGTEIFSKKLSTNSLTISDLNSGMYFLKILNTSSNIFTIKKLIKN